MGRYNGLMAATILLAVLAIAALNMSNGGSSNATPNPTFASAAIGSTIVISATNNGYNISNISQTNPFTITLNGSIFNAYVSYIMSNSTGLVLNRSVYVLYLNQPVQVRKTPGTFSI